MPSFKTHCKLSEIRTGNKFEALHAWIDEPYQDLGPDHRTKRHSFNRAEADFIRRTWGEKAVVEWLFHIAVDNLHTAFKFAKTTYGSRAFNFFRFGLASNGFIFIDAEPASDAELEEEFDDVYEEY